jgi:flagellum-specific peptidoglycan hydrolase FlgJ
MAALVSLSAGGAITGFSFVPKAAADFSSPTSLPLNLVALRQAVQPPQAERQAPDRDAMLRAAIVHVTDYYLRMAQTKTPAEMEAMIWQQDSIDGADHGQSCAAFASLTLELGAQVVGHQSWVSGGASYPWPLHAWADVRVEPNPASLGITSIQQDAQAHARWHPLGDGYRPLPGDWVLFDGHVEVVTQDAGGVLHTVGGDSLPNFSVNAHEYQGPPAAAGVVGFVNNGAVPEGGPAAGGPEGAPAAGAGHAAARHPSRDRSAQRNKAAAAPGELASIPGQAAGPGPTAAPAAGPVTDPAIPGPVPAQRPGSAARAARHAHEKQAGHAGKAHAGKAHDGKAAHEGRPRPEGHTAATAREQVSPGDAAIPGLAAASVPSDQGAAYRRHHPSPARTPVSESRLQQAFISQIAPGAIVAQHRYGVPAAVTIAQAIDESGWGQSELAAQDHNLFGIKGTGPAGSVPLPTQEYVNGQPVSTSASFRAYHNVAESIDDHGRLLARSGYYQQAMTDRQHPDKFAAALTGVYATDPNYGANLISLMRRYDLYRYGAADPGQAPQRAAAAEPGGAAIPGVGGTASAAAERTGSATPPAASRKPARKHAPEPTRTASPEPTRTATPEPSRTPLPRPTGSGSPQPTRTATPEPSRTPLPQPTGSGSPQPTRTATPEPSRATGPPQPAGTANPQPARTAAPGPGAAASPQPAVTGRPHGTAAGRPRATPAATRPRPGSRRPAAPSAALAQPVIPGVTTPAGPESATTSAVRFGPASAFVPVAQPEAASAMTSAVRFGPAAPFVAAAPSAPARSAPARSAPAQSAPGRSAPAQSAPAQPARARTAAARPAPVRATLVSARRYQPQIPRSVLNSFIETAKGPLLGEEEFYRDVASFHGISWELLAACDWMQCDARPRRSPVYGEKLGTVNADGTVYTSKSAALARCADDLVTLARTVYGIDLTRGTNLSVRDLANAFAAFRWGRALKDADFSAMKFPYSVAGLSDHHLSLRWPDFAPRNSGDRPGGRFHRRFGAVPVVLSLDYPATV